MIKVSSFHSDLHNSAPSICIGSFAENAVFRTVSDLGQTMPALLGPNLSARAAHVFT